MTTIVSAGNMLNKIITSSDVPFVARVAVWIAYYSLMPALAKELDAYARMIHARYEPIEPIQPDPGFVRATRVERLATRIE